MVDSSYLMNDQREAKRLASKVNSKEWIDKYLDLYLSANANVLDIGCGPGHLAKYVAQRVSSVVGVDLHPERFPNISLPKNLILQEGDAKNLPFEDDKFDISYMRFLLEYLPDKQHIVNEAVRVTKPGGIILIQDLDGQLVWHYPPQNDLEELLKEAMIALEETGFDPFVGRKIFSYLEMAKAINIKTKVEPYHMIVGTIDDVQREQWKLKLDIAKKALSKLKSESFAEKLCITFLQYLDSPQTLTYSNIFTVVGTINKLANINP